MQYIIINIRAYTHRYIDIRSQGQGYAYILFLSSFIHLFVRIYAFIFFCAFHFKICSCSFACICFLWVCVFCHTMPCDWVERHHFGNSRTRLCKHLEKNFPPGTQVSPLLFTLLLLLLLLCTICMLLLWCFCFDCAQAQDQAHFS